MWSLQHDLLRLLEIELRFVDGGGYRNPEMWRPQFTFLDSPTCAHPAGSGRPDACKDCLLMMFVPSARRNAAVPCHHIPLTKEGFTIDSLQRWGTPEELADALRSWLMKNISELKKAGAVSPESKSIDSIDSVCGRSCKQPCKQYDFSS